MTRFGLAPRGEELLQLEADTLTHSHSSLLPVRFGFVESPCAYMECWLMAGVNTQLQDVDSVGLGSVIGGNTAF